jgi:hypothetical protein
MAVIASADEEGTDVLPYLRLSGDWDNLSFWVDLGIIPEPKVAILAASIALACLAASTEPRL